MDFLVDDDAFSTTAPILTYREELNDVIRIGVTDLLGVPPKYAWLREERRLEGGLPVISLRGLVLMKLDAGRDRDKADVRALLTGHPDRIMEVRTYLRSCAPALLPRLADILAPR